MISRKSPLVFSFVRDQTIFLAGLLALLSFLAIMALGITIGIGNGVGKWNSRWDTFATIQILPGGDSAAVTKLIDENKRAIKSAIALPDSEVEKMLRPWLGSSDALSAYLPKVIEVEFNKKSSASAFGEKVRSISNVRFITHAAGAKNITRAGWQIMTISALVMLMVLGAIALCILYITRNITMIHKRELEILTQVGANDSFVAREVRSRLLKVGAIAATAGLFLATPMLMLIMAMAQGTRIGLMAQMGIPVGGWIAIIILAIGMVALTAFLAHRTTMKILNNNQ